MSLREYKKARAASRGAGGGSGGAGDCRSPMSGYEMYRLSLLKHLVGAEYADASSDDLSSDWEEPDDAGHKVKKVHIASLPRYARPFSAIAVAQSLDVESHFFLYSRSVP
ncbi:hypothetical protein V5799_029543 [Amblyomma americanum]|uniref:Uncharacterized protein n=1 Tax=Amblyomma americanum TaxID=6943 RepID=A0AAQ4EQT7_AMBAM